MKNMLALFIIVLFSQLGLAEPTAITPVVPSETVNEAGFVTSDGTNGNSIKNRGGEIILIIKNETAASAGVATIVVQNSTVAVSGLGNVTKTSLICTLAFGENCVVGPFSTAFFNDGNSNIQITYTGDAKSDMDVLALEP